MFKKTFNKLGKKRTDKRRGFDKKDFRESRDPKERGSFTGRRPFRRSPKFQLSRDAVIDYKNYTLLQKFVTERGKIVNSRLSGVSAKEQRQLTHAIKLARNLALLPSGGTRGV